MRSLVASMLLLAACSNPTEPEPSLREDVETTTPAQTPIAPFDECTVTTYREPALGAGHVAECADFDMQSFPPTGGDHFGVWAAWGTYDAPVPWGYLIHSMEHGAIVLGYRCDDGCPEVVAEFEAIADLIDDPLCRGEEVPRRVIIAPMPDLDVAIAALGWEHGYLATCLDPPSLRSFVTERYGLGRENLCNPGADRSDMEWCDG